MEYTQKNMLRGRKSNMLLGVGLAVLLAASAFFSGLQLGTGATQDTSLEAGLFSFLTKETDPITDADLGEFWHVWRLLDKKFVSSATTSSLTTEERVQGAIDGLVESYGDPYTVFFPPADATQFEQDIAGNFGGVGMEVGMRNGIVTVISPLPDTPAEKAGIVGGDVITKIDDNSTDKMNIDEAVNLIRGEKGTEVVLTIYRQGETDFIEIPVIRGTISIPTIETEEIDDVFIISLYSFNALSDEKMYEAVQTFQNSTSKKLILDLRGNPGGFLQSAVTIGGYFLPNGKVVVRESFGEDIDEQVYRTGGKRIADLNPDTMVVLTDGGSASASEILAGALKEHAVATVIGDTTFGKGSVQELVNLPDGSSLKVTVARWLTPEGVSFSDGGLEPDIKIIRTPQQVIEQVDPQKEAAIAWLEGKRDFVDPEIEEEIFTEKSD